MTANYREYEFLQRRWLFHRAGAFQHGLREEVFPLGFVADNFVVRGLEQLLFAVAKLLANGLLDARVLQFALSGGFFADQPHDAVAKDLVAVGVGDNQYAGVLAWFQLADGLEGLLVALQRGLGY